jgi:hypothetical protein
MTKKFQLAVSTALAALLVACGGGGGGTDSAQVSSGTFINSPTKGIKYSATPSGLTGTTDENGTYTYKAGDTVTFKLDLGSTTLTLGSTSNPSAATSVLTLSVPNGGDPLAVAQVLETLDKSSVDGKMDVSGISLPAGNSAISSISGALTSTKVAAADISAIASAVQTTLTANNAGALKYGVTGVSPTVAMANLSKNPANQSLLDQKISNTTSDGSTLLIFQDRPALTQWVVKYNGETTHETRIGIIRSNLTYDFQSPGNSTTDLKINGSYTLSNGNKTGNWISSDNSANRGTFEILISDDNGSAFKYKNNSQTEEGSIIATYLKPLTLNDIKSKSITLLGACANGGNAVVTFDASARASENCGLGVNGTVWSAGPIANSLRFTDSSGRAHFVSLTQLDPAGGSGNLPSGASGAMADLYWSGDTSTRYTAVYRTYKFRVN